MDSKFTIGAVCFMIIWLALIRKSQGAVINVIKYGAAYQKKKKIYGAKADGKSDDRQVNKFSLILESFIEINLLKCFHLLPFCI